MLRYVYLIRNGDLYKIGQAKNLERRMRELKPDELLGSMKIKDAQALEARLLRRFKSQRIPETDYFRLNEKQVADCLELIKTKNKLGTSLASEVSIGLTASIFFLIVSFIIFSWIGIGPRLAFIYSLLTGSLPMWTIFIFGSFGGYDIEDLPWFFSWSNRIKSLLIALSMASVAYFFYHFRDFFSLA